MFGRGSVRLADTRRSWQYGLKTNMSIRGDDQPPAKRYSLRQVETNEVERGQFDRIESEGHRSRGLV